MVEPVAARYHLTHLLTRCGPYEVHAADDRWLHRSVALAFCRPRSAAEPEGATPAQRAQFEAMGRAGVRISHPRVADVYDLGRHEGALFVAFERPHADLTGELASGPLDEARLGRLAVGLAAAVDALHRAGASHGHLHPGAVGIGADGGVRLTPWPVADTPPGWGGERAWQPSERLVGEAPSVRSDVWSAGAVLLSAAIGAGPGSLADGEVGEVAERLRESLDPALVAAIGRAMSLDPTERYASASDLGLALEAAAAGHGAEAAALAGSRRAMTPPAVRVRPLRRPAPGSGRRTWQGAVAALAALSVPLVALQIDSATAS
ncbi:MAG TPA: hypothetical protein VFH45_01475, partial [Acidimicrobiales bacterium]|nr:hypothetical protein [Acidimicrobiales bacterium]